MGTVLTLACIIGCLSVGIKIGRQIARRDSVKLYVAMGFACFLSVLGALAFFHDNLSLLACVVSLAVSVFTAAWTQSGAEQDGRHKERDDIAARQLAMNGPLANQPNGGNVHGQTSKPVNRFGAALTGSPKPRRKVDYIKLVAMNYNVPYGRKGKAKLRSVK